MLTQFLADKSAEMAPHFQPAFLQRPQTNFQFIFDSGDPFYLEVDGASFKFTPGEIEQPTITLYIKDHATCWNLLDGSLDGMNAFMDGSYRADGNIVLSQLILYLFRSLEPVLNYEIQD
ncbi:MAG: hypothetical protein CMQ20_11625 [Gammaproteobacteria bacterium]|jgi:putative sterol carrier protein|nr:hypothetical protein [Gammaproteobacteria bacterium]|tara:strand:+ start:29 stop:385 length:357 start_codon:yes stop_codon:yes gene_type:complete